MSEYLPIERYRIVLKHEYVGNEGKPYQIEEPLCIEYMVPHSDYLPPSTVLINEMMDRLKTAMLDRVKGW